MIFRVGCGQDTHPFGTDSSKPLKIGGIVIDGLPGFIGNSDGDVILHALCDAIEQALGGDSFALYADPLCQNGITDSAAYVAVACEHLVSAGYRVNNVGISVECKIPKIMPQSDVIRERIASLLNIEKSMIGINATSGEELSEIARGKGVRAHVIISIIKG